MHYLFLIFLIPSLAHAVPGEISWDKNAEEEMVTEYEVRRDGIPFLTSPDNVHDIDLAGGECFTVAAINLFGRSDPSAEVCAPAGASSPSNLTITYTDRNGNPVVITVPLPLIQ